MHFFCVLISHIYRQNDVAHMFVYSNIYCSRLPLMAKKLEEHLYRSAHLKDAYVDLASLKKRLHLIAKGVGIEKSNTPSVCSIGSQSSPSLVFQTSSGRNLHDNNAPHE